jgi:hypothetical protein
MFKNALVLIVILCLSKVGYAQWTTTNLSSNRVHFGAVEFENRLYFIGGNTGSGVFTDVVDIYDLASNSFLPASSISSPRRQSAIAAGDSAIYVLGGHEIAQTIIVGTNIVDIFKNGSWHTDTIADSLYHGTAIKVGSKILFSGFIKSNNTTAGIIDASDLVYIFDEANGQWSTANLSSPRMGLSAATNGTLAIFAGGENGPGVPSDVVDIYNATSNTWSTATLSDPKAFTSAVYANGKFYVIGGALSGSGSSTDVIDVFDGSNWTTLNLPFARAGIKAVAHNEHIYMAGGGDFNLFQFVFANSTNRVDILNTSNNTWSNIDMSLERINHVALAADNRLFVAGGFSTIQGDQTSLVEIYDFTLGLEHKTKNAGFIMTPNPASYNVSIKVEHENIGKILQISDLMGKVVLRQKVENTNTLLPLETLDNGLYMVQLENLINQRIVVQK